MHFCTSTFLFEIAIFLYDYLISLAFFKSTLFLTLVHLLNLTKLYIRWNISSKGYGAIFYTTNIINTMTSIPLFLLAKISDYFRLFWFYLRLFGQNYHSFFESILTRISDYQTKTPVCINILINCNLNGEFSISKLRPRPHYINPLNSKIFKAAIFVFSIIFISNFCKNINYLIFW